MNENDVKKDLIEAFELGYFQLSQFVKDKMMKELNSYEIALKLADMAKIPALTKFGGG